MSGDASSLCLLVSSGLTNYSFTTTRSTPGWQSGLTIAQRNMKPLALFSFVFILLLLIWTFSHCPGFRFAVLLRCLRAALPRRTCTRQVAELPSCTGTARHALFSSACALHFETELKSPHVCEEGTLAGSHLPSLYSLLILTLSLCLAIRVLAWV